jgi:predicted glycoside hydrolase/deacetylase ChbG (UPF0249 family)
LRRLVVNADDFGFTHDVNDGIVEAHRKGILTATTLMANGAAFDHAVTLARKNSSLDIGVHLVLVSGRSLLDCDRPLPATVSEMLKAVVTGRLRVYEELDAQVRKIVDAGIQLTHLDAHKHTHLFPPVLNAVARLSKKYGIRWVRRPFDYPLNPQGVPPAKRLLSRGLGFLRRHFHNVLSSSGCRTTDHFAGFQITGRFGPEDLARLIRQLPEGSTEFMCHPGFCGPELMAARTRLKESRMKELEALTSSAVWAAIEESGVQLVSYRDL